jgi:hypothetical protein
MILTKLAGAGCIILGFFMIVYFPDSDEMQYSTFVMTFVLFGIFLILLGIYLIKVG